LKNGIIFCNRKTEVAALHRSLVRHGFSALALHGDMDQSSRTAALEKFRRGEVTLLVASDVAARGLDIPDVSHIYNFDVPHHPDDYVHRIGRTGRAGRSGIAITLVAPADGKSVGAIEKLIGQTIPWAVAPAATDTSTEEPRPSERPRHRSARSHERRPSAAPAKRPAPLPAQPKAARPEAARARDAEGFHLPAFLLRPVKA
jgi:superfamily II DNA/RNA helicase